MNTEHDPSAVTATVRSRFARRIPQTLAVSLLFVALTALMTWPQVEYLGTRAREHHDVFFNLWRLQWIAHALESSPSDLFDGNIFHPERRTLTYSDAMLVEGTLGAPFLWAGVPPVLVHNLLLLGAIAASGVAMFTLARSITGSAAAGILAGIVFAFVPFRFEHYMHMEMQWTMWTPWAFWAFHRTHETASRKYGVATGIFVALQMLSSIYYGIFLGTLLGVCGLLLLIASPFRRSWSTVRALVPGVLLAAVICGAYARPYIQTKAEMGGRSPVEIQTFSARPSSYLVATPDNVIWGKAFASRGRMERRLFPGAAVVVLALVGLLLRPPTPIALAYLVSLAVAFDMSLGMSGHVYPLLYERVPVYQGLRALARLGIFVAFFLAGLAAYGFTALTEHVRPATRRRMAVAIALVMLAEYHVRPLALIRYPNTPPPLYAWLAEQPRGVVAELPMRSDEVPDFDPAYSYLSTFHWQPIVNGYSGFYPQSYVDRLDAMKGFPDDRSMSQLRFDGVRYVVVHLMDVDERLRERMLDTLANGYGLPELGRFYDGRGESVVYGMR